LTVYIPLYIGASDTTVTAAKQGLLTDYDSESGKGEIYQSSIIIKQYNAYQLFGNKGFPYDE
jgi:hypothetical protein